ncbi:Imm8 family immunity protein [Grimontia marina]|uniref:Immunity protein 8 n=1 Tax=Grimontia marina TaxID=646534 RepID=A0A128FKC9_9GAMM|nr:Imm8 family immunity protein [Grimontia marina]CZF87030.1 hypothetical protein GMA8713_05071 [Grimontia marina]
MMELSLKGLDVAGDYLLDHKPDNADFFSLWLTVTVGVNGEEGSSSYQLHICTPDWIRYAVENELEDHFLWGRHMLIVDKFDAEKIEIAIEKKLKEISSQFSNDSQSELLKKVSRYAYWEYEDYETNKDSHH